MEERLGDSLMNSIENSKQHTDVPIEEDLTEQQARLLPRREEAPRPYVLDINNWFVNADFVANVEEDLMQEEDKSMKMQKLEESNNNLKTRERKYVYQTKDVLDLEIEELWQLMMTQLKWRKLMT